MRNQIHFIDAVFAGGCNKGLAFPCQYSFIDQHFLIQFRCVQSGCLRELQKLKVILAVLCEVSRIDILPDFVTAGVSPAHAEFGPAVCLACDADFIAFFNCPIILPELTSGVDRTFRTSAVTVPEAVLMYVSDA